jgi:hypothetical protein
MRTTCSAHLEVSPRNIKVKKKKAIPVTGRGDLYGCEMLRIPHCLENRLVKWR